MGPPPPKRPFSKSTSNRNWSKSFKNILIGIAVVCIVLALSGYISDDSSSSPPPDSDPFLLSHTLDPSKDPDKNYQSWRSKEWLDWLNRRERLHTRAKSRRSRSRCRLNEKYVNTVVIATPERITEVFTGNLQMYGSEMVWSNRVLPTYLFLKSNNGRYQVYICPPTYIAVKLVNGKPVHLQTFNTVRVETGNFAYRTICKELK